MSSTGGNLDNPLELVQKTYNLQSTTNTHENPSPNRPSVAKVSIHQPSRKSSVHDIHQVNRDHLTKILVDIEESLSRLKYLLEPIKSVAPIRDEFFKLKNHLFSKILETIQKLAGETGKRGSITSKRSSSATVSHHPHHLVCCIEYFRSELVRAQYLFYSLTLSASIGSGTLNTITIKSPSDLNIEQTPVNGEDMQNLNDLIEITKDISSLEEHAYVLTQRYYSQIPDWHESADAMGTDGTLNNPNGITAHRFRLTPLNHKMSTTSSVTSNEHLSFCARIYQKCQVVCCYCRPNYL